MVLDTGLEHIDSAAELEKLIKSSENVMVCCGRMGPMCVPVYAAMENLRDSGDYSSVEFRDMLFDHPEAAVIKSLPECATFRGLPFTIYYRNGKVVKATSSIQDEDQVASIIKDVF